MKIFCKNSSAIILTAIFAVVVFCFGGSSVVQAAGTSPSLGDADSYSILSGTQVTNSGATTISGNVGISPAGGGGTTGFGTVTFGAGSAVHNADTAAANAQSALTTAYGNLASQVCDTTYVGASKELGGETLAPGVYCADRFFLSGTLTLNGSSSDVWVFKSAADLIISGGAAAKVVFTGGGLACHVWWRVVSTATFDAGSSLAGSILAGTSVTLANGASLDGRALASTAEVTLVGNAISGPTCAAAAPVSSGGERVNRATINVVKMVINDNGGIKTVEDFPLFVNGTLVASNATIVYPAPATYTVTETNDPNYTRTFSGDCDVNGGVNLTPGAYRFCIITNNDIGAPIVAPPVPPLIDVVKVPSPLALPNGPGSVLYTYTVRNIGTVPMTDVKLVGDTCSPIVLVSGDTNNDAKLDLDEVWVHTCSTTLTETHTNTVVATGWANGISASDIASATVIVSEPIVPPLIHLTKVPSPLTLLAGGGMVTYTKRVSNPGTVALSNVSVTDDQCALIEYMSGDTNRDSKLDPSETWVYTCRTNITQTTLNTAYVTGEANGLTARDFALATVVVADVVPALPNTGLSPGEKSIPWNIILVSGIFALVSISLAVVVKKRAN